jgi:hypothetical protein
MADSMAIKRALMRLPRPVYRHVAFPLWLRAVDRWQASSAWKFGSYGVGDRVWWRGVRLICCTEHYAGMAADHPWDPGHGWPAERANALWEPKGARDRVLLQIIGDPRRPEARSDA